MAMNAADIERLIKTGLPGAEVTITDLAGERRENRLVPDGPLAGL